MAISGKLSARPLICNWQWDASLVTTEPLSKSPILKTQGGWESFLDFTPSKTFSLPHENPEWNLISIDESFEGSIFGGRIFTNAKKEGLKIEFIEN